MTDEIIGIAIAAVLAVVGWILLSTSEADSFINPLSGEKDRVALTRERQIEIGQEVRGELEPELGGVENNRRVDEIANVLFQSLKQLEVQRPFPNNNPRHLSNFPYSFRVLRSEEVVNALALPGGPIYITRSLYDLLPSDDMIAAVLAHEIGHVALRHSAKSFETILKGELALNLLGKLLSRGQQSVYDASALADYLLQLRFSRDREADADQFGYMLLCIAGYDPRAMSQVFEVFESLSSGQNPEWTLTHPLPGSRISAVNGYSCSF